MIKQEGILLKKSSIHSTEKLGTISYVIIFFWSISLIILLPEKYILLAGGLCLFAATLFYPKSFQRIMRLRWLMMIAILAIPPIFVVGNIDQSLMGIPYSTEGVSASLVIFTRVIVVLISIDGFTNSVDISSIASLFERIGFRGLGFTMGVALNLLPSMERAAINTWQSLWMRGGLRKKRWDGIRYLLVTIITNALNRTEQISLAADGRAFNPNHRRPILLQKGSLDLVVLGGIVLLTIVLILLF